MSGRLRSSAKAINSGMWVFLWVWLLVLSALVWMAFRTMADLAERDNVHAVQNQTQTLQSQMADLSDRVDLLQMQPEPATVQALHDTRQGLERRITHIEHVLESREDTGELDALRDDLSQLKATLEKPKPVVQSEMKPVHAVAATPKPVPFPFRIVGLERRAGQPSLALVPTNDELTADGIHIVLVGETIGRWHLQRIDGMTAVFQAGKQTRRLSIPKVGGEP